MQSQIALGLLTGHMSLLKLQSETNRLTGVIRASHVLIARFLSTIKGDLSTFTHVSQFKYFKLHMLDDIYVES